jgi:hypothetical protein
VFTVQWKDYKRYGAAYAGDTFDFQIKLYEATGQIEIVYGEFTPVYNAAPPLVQVGLRGAISMPASSTAKSSLPAAITRLI